MLEFRVCRSRDYKMAEFGKSSIEMTSLDMDDEKAEKTKQIKSRDAELCVYKESKEPVQCTSLDGVKGERLPAPERSPSSGVTLNVQMTYLDMDKKKKQENIPEDQDGYKETEKPMPCRWVYAERLPAPESNFTPGVTLNKPDEKEEKYLEIIDDVTMQKENLSDESKADQIMLFRFVKFEAEPCPASGAGI